MAHNIPKSQNLTDKTIKGGIWIYGRTIATAIVNLIVIAILARLLTPEEFGIVALAHVILQLFMVIGSQGINEFVIYDNKEGKETRAVAAFWMDITFAISCTIIGFAILPLVVNFYSTPELKFIIIALLLRFPVDSISKIPDALLKKRLEFKKIEIRDTILNIFGGILSIILAFKDFGFWSLIIPTLIVSPLRSIIVFSISKWRPSFNLYTKYWKSIFIYSSNVIGGTLTSFTLKEGDTLLVGKLMGNQVLGVYNLAWKCAHLVIKIFNSVVHKVGLPALSTVSNDETKLVKGLNKMMTILSIITIPILVGLFVVADDFILSIYGPQWVGSIILLRIMIIHVIRFSVGYPIGIIYKAIGRPDITFKIGLVTVPFYLGSIWFGSKFGIIGVAIGVTAIRTVIGFISFEIVARCLNISFTDVIKPVFPAIISSLIMGILMYVLKLILNEYFDLHSAINLAIISAFGIFIYIFLLRTSFNNMAKELASLTAPFLGGYQKYVAATLNV